MVPRSPPEARQEDQRRESVRRRKVILCDVSLAVEGMLILDVGGDNNSLLVAFLAARCWTDLLMRMRF